MTHLLTTLAATLLIAAGEAEDGIPRGPSGITIALMSALPLLAWIGRRSIAFRVVRIAHRSGGVAAEKALRRGQTFLSGTILVLFGWGNLFGGWFGWVKSGVPPQIPGVAWFLVLLPYLAAAVAGSLAREEHGFGGSPIRVGLRAVDWRPLGIVIVPYLIVGTLFDLTYFVPAVREFLLVQPLAGAIAPLALLVPAVGISPYLLGLLWPSHSLPAGPQRQRFELLARQASVGVRDIRVWETGEREVLNACIAGIAAPVRTIFLTDAILRHLDSNEIEAVFAHELGHARHGHLVVFLALIAAFLCVIEWAGSLVSVSSPTALLGFSLFAVIYFRGGFGIMSRHFESQADLFSARLTGSTGASARALERVALLTGGRWAHRGWRHHPVPRRIEILWRAALDPAYAHRFQRRARLYRGLVFGTLLLAAGGFATVLHTESQRPEFEQQVARAEFWLHEQLRSEHRPWVDRDRREAALRLVESLLRNAYEEACQRGSEGDRLRILDRLAETSDLRGPLTRTPAVRAPPRPAP